MMDARRWIGPILALVLAVPAALLPLADPAWGTRILWVASLSLASAGIAGLISFKDRDAWPWERRLWGLGAWAAAVALATMVLHFLRGDLDVQYVWSHTDVTYPWYYKLAGTWGGQEGTIILWAACIAAFGFLAAPARDADRDTRRLYLGARVILAMAAGSLTALAIYQPAFAETGAAFLRAVPRGSGLQEVLVTPLMVIHPPMQFVAYALASVPAAFALSGVVTGVRTWSVPALRWARPAWGMATIGLGLGGLWAYYVLSFGGFWAWDPVETANLLPWLTLTGFMHAVKEHGKRGAFPLAAPALAALSYILYVFATFATRSGLWVSVHAFTDPSSRFNPDAAGRLLSILDIHAPSGYFLGMLGFMIGLTAAVLLHGAHQALPPGKRVARGVLRGGIIASILYAALAAVQPGAWISSQFELGHALGLPAGYGAAITIVAIAGVPLAWAYVDAPEPAARSGSKTHPKKRSILQRIIEPKALMAAGVVLFTLSAAVAAIVNFSVVNGMNRFVFDVRAPFLAVPILLVMTLMLAHPHIGRPRTVALAGGSLAIGIAAAYRMPDHWVAALALPVLAGALVAGLVKVVSVNRGAKGALRWGGILVLLAGLLGAVMWSNPPNHLALGPFGVLHGGLLHAFTLVPLSILAMAGGVATLRRTGFPLAVAGGVASVVVAGFGVGAVVGAAGLALVVMNRGRFDEAGGVRAFAVRTLPGFKQTGMYLIHVAVVIGLAGFTMATYEATYAGWTIVDPADQGETVRAGDLGFTFTGMAGGDQPGDMEGLLEVTDETGASLGTAELHFWYRVSGVPRYLGEVDVHRDLFVDRYFVPAAFATEGPDGALQWTELGKRVDPVKAFTLDRSSVKAVAFDVALLPFVGLVWAGLYLMGVGMLVVIVSDALERGFVPAANRAGAKATGKARDRKARERPVLTSR